MIIDYFKKKYYWTKVFNELRISLDKFQNEKYLLFGYPKSGNTWLRFLIFNYFNLILNKNVTSTLTYDHLNKILFLMDVSYQVTYVILALITIQSYT